MIGLVHRLVHWLTILFLLHGIRIKYQQQNNTELYSAINITVKRMSEYFVRLSLIFALCV